MRPALVVCTLALLVGASAQELQQPPKQASNATRSLFTYAGSLLPADWTLVSLLDERAVIGFANGSARNALLSELEPRERAFLQRLQNGTAQANPLASAKEKLAQWSSSFSSTVTKLGKNVRDQLDQLINNKPANATMLVDA